MNPLDLTYAGAAEQAPLIAEAVGTARLSVASEVGPLRRVIVHRPSLELGRLTPKNRADMLFDDVVWVERAAQEHDALTDALRARGVQVLYLHDLLTETLAVPEARAEIVAGTAEAACLGPTLGPALVEWLSTLPCDELARRLISGVTYGEFPFTTNSLTALVAQPTAFAVTPLPNHMFTRDASAWAYGGVSIHAMRMPARVREALHFAAIYRHHPLFAGSTHEVWSDGMHGAPELEGGDILVLGNSALLVGIGERTLPAAVEAYARRLFEAGVVERVVVTVLPAARSTIHLDTVLSQVDVDAFTIFPAVCSQLEAYVLTPASSGVRAEAVGSLLRAIEAVLDVPAVRLIHCAHDCSVGEQEQWHEANNVLAVEPGVVITYDRNAHTNARLRQHGVQVIEIPSSELARGRGGPRCLTCPIERDPI
jgi:arginine deiminase